MDFDLENLRWLGSGHLVIGGSCRVLKGGLVSTLSQLLLQVLNFILLGFDHLLNSFGVRGIFPLTASGMRWGDCAKGVARRNWGVLAASRGANWRGLATNYCVINTLLPLLHDLNLLLGLFGCHSRLEILSNFAAWSSMIFVWAGGLARFIGRCFRVLLCVSNVLSAWSWHVALRNEGSVQFILGLSVLVGKLVAGFGREPRLGCFVGLHLNKI